MNTIDLKIIWSENIFKIITIFWSHNRIHVAQARFSNRGVLFSIILIFTFYLFVSDLKSNMDAIVNLENSHPLHSFSSAEYY